MSDQTTALMKLSDAMRAGAKLHPQAHGFLRDLEGNTCAIGAALEGAGCRYPSFAFVTNYFPGMDDVVSAPDGIAVNMTDTLEDIIMHLNDDLRWTREQIADWLESIGY